MAVSLSKEAPSLRVRTDAGTARVLRAHFARHNRQVLLLAVAIFITSLAAWLLLYFMSCWLVTLAIAVFDLPFTHIPRGYSILYIVTALCAIAYAWVDHLLTPNVAPRDAKGAGEVISEFILAIPNLTLAAGGTLAAWQRLDDAELVLAATLLHRVATEKRVPMSGVRLEIPDPAVAARVLFALQLTQVLDVHRDGSEFWLRLNALRPTSLRLAPESHGET